MHSNHNSKNNTGDHYVQEQKKIKISRSETEKRKKVAQVFSTKYIKWPRINRQKKWATYVFITLRCLYVDYIQVNSLPGLIGFLGCKLLTFLVILGKFLSILIWN